MALLTSRGKRPEFKWRPTTFEQGKSFTVPAPFGGLNLRDDITALKQNEARILENWLPTTGQLSIRPGYSAWATGMGTGEVKTLAAYFGYSASKMLAGANGKIYDATSSGAASQLATGFSVDRWQTALYSDRLFFVNGTDAPQVYDGSTVAGIVWAGSGLTNTNLINIALVRNRLWFAEKDKAHVWYANVGQITAATDLTKFQLEQIASGGTCMAIGSWSQSDAGDGADDFTVFVMSTGEVIVYQGDPATSFSLIGKYQTGAPPIGRQCLFRVGGELIIITRQGYLPVSACASSQPGKALNLSNIDPWGKIAPGLAADAASHASKAGWHGCVHLGLVYGNVPLTEGSISKQRVLNTRNDAWTDYTNWNASSLCPFDSTLYFGAMTGGKTYKVTGGTDNSGNITCLASGAFVYPTKTQLTNTFTAARPKIQAEGTVTGRIGVDTDFVIRIFTAETVDFSNDTGGSDWDTSPWDTTDWGQAGDSMPLWYSITGHGKAVSVRLVTVASTNEVKWFATDLLYKPGGIR